MVYGGHCPPYIIMKGTDMLIGKISKYNDGVGQIITEEKTYNFNLTVVQANGDIKDGDEITFDVDHYNNVNTIIRATTKDSASGAVTIKKESSSKNKKVLLTEEK